MKKSPTNWLPIRLRSLREISMILIILACTSLLAQNVYDDEKSIKQLKIVLQRKPNDAKTLFKLGWYMQKKNLPRKALSYYKKCIKVDPRFVSAHVNMGNIYKRSRNFRNAELSYKKAIRLNSNSAIAHYNLGTLYMKQKNASEGMVHLEKTISLQPNNKSAHLNLAFIYIGLYKKSPNKAYLNTARDHLFQAAEIDKTYAHVYYNLGRLYELDNQATVALQYYKEAVRYYKPTARFRKRAIARIQRIEYIVRN